MPDDIFRRVAITNTDTGTPTEFNLVIQRLEELKSTPTSGLKMLTPWGTGVDSAAVQGMLCIFESLPPKFPLEAVLNWLHQEAAPMQERIVIESALAALGRKYV
jgi:hypothetical protein